MPSATLKNCKKKLMFNKKTKKFKTIPLHLDTRVLILYISERKYITAPRKFTVDEILTDATGYLQDDHYMDGLELRCRADQEGLKKISMEKLKEVLKKALTQKYRSRPSPPFSAAELCNYTLVGNDGQLYKSIKSGKTCVWRPLL